jgi:hypothetical protein
VKCRNLGTRTCGTITRTVINHTPPRQKKQNNNHVRRIQCNHTRPPTALNTLPRAMSTCPEQVGASPPVTRLTATYVRAPSRILVVVLRVALTLGRHSDVGVDFCVPPFARALSRVSELDANRDMVVRWRVVASDLLTFNSQK